MSETYGEPQSRNEAILQNILGEHNELVYPQSRNEAILQAILYNTAYTEEARSRIETLLLCILNGTTTDMQPLSRNEEILIAKINGGTYDKEPQSRIEQLLIDWLNAYEEKTVSGAIVSITDAIAGPVIRCECEVNAKQASGTPTPENPLLISGFTGLNLYRTGSNVWDEEWELGDIDSNTGAPIPSNNVIRTKNFIPIKPDTQYFAYVTGTGTSTFRTRFYDRDKNFIGSTQKNGNPVGYNSVFTSPVNAYYMKFTPQIAYGTTYQNDISINYPSTDRNYHAYTGTVYPVTWQTEAGTVYGCLLNPITGVLTVTHGVILDLGQLTYTKNANYAYIFNSPTIQGAYSPESATERNKGIMCETYKPSSSTNVSSTMDNYGFLMLSASGGARFAFRNDDYENLTTDQFKTSMSGVKLIYPLAQPQTYQLQAVDIELKQGINTVYHDGNGDITLTYKGG